MTMTLTVVVGLADCVNDGSVRTGCCCCCSAVFLLFLSAGYIVVFAFSSVRNSDSSVRNKLKIETPGFTDQARKEIGVGRISLLLLLSLLGTLLLWELGNDGITSFSIVLLLTRSTEEDELLLL